VFKVDAVKVTFSWTAV